MKKRWKKQARKKKTVGIFTCLMFLVVVAAGSVMKEDSLIFSVIRQAKSEGYIQMLKTTSPSIFYEKERRSFAQIVLDRMFDTIPVYGYIVNAEGYTTQTESDISYETIIAREAMDENYVDDKTGEVMVADENGQPALLEDTAIIEENQTEAAVTESQPQAENTEKPEELQQTQTATEQQVAEVAAPQAANGFIPNQTPVVSYSPEKLNDFDYLIQNFYVVDRTTTIDSSRLNASELLSKSMRLTHSPDVPQILIYHTHSQERFADSVDGDAATSIVGVGDYLMRLLGQYGFHVIHHTGEYDVDSRDDAYAKAGPALEQILAQNPSVEIVIDLHRDGVAEGTHLVTEQGGKQMASIMFFNGLSHTTSNGDIGYLPNPYIKDNLAFSLQMQIAAEEYYPGFSRNIYLKGYRYNMHYCPKTLLVEVGAQTNTVQEAMNAMEPLADILAKVLTR